MSKHIDHLRLTAALTKAGATVTAQEHRPDAFIARKGDRLVCWYTQAGFPNAERLAATCVRTPSPHTDAQTDCFCDTWHHTIKAAAGFIGGAL